jgi:8-oxo-dGTP diphosphatase
MSRAGRTDSPHQNRLAAAVVLHNGRVLVVRRSFAEQFLPGVWGIPCGKLGPGEDPESGALRELKEETGLIGEVRRLAGRSEFTSEWNGQAVHNAQANYLVKPLSFEITLPNLDQDYRWVSVSELDSAGLDDHNLRAIKQALRLRYAAQ